MTRQCGDCQLCCRLLAVRSLAKPYHTKCKFQKFHKGCTVYNTPAMPPECKIWNCRWIVNDDTADLSRPDRSHYVIDIMPDFVTLQTDAGKEHHFEAVQIWIDPAHPDAHRDPALRRYLLRLGARGAVGMVRYDNARVLLLVPPNMIGGTTGALPAGWSVVDGWLEVPSAGSNVQARPQHSFSDIEAALGRINVVVEE